MTSDAAAPGAPRPASPRRARTVLLGACASGLAGLALLGGTGTAGLSAAAVADVTPVYEVAPVVAPVAVAPKVIALRAARTRTVPVKKVVAASRPASKKVVRLSGDWVRPSYAGVISPYGMRWGRMHKGIDFGAPYGAAIRAIGDGVVVGTGYQGEESGYGQITLIRHSDGMVSAYAHQSRMVVSVGDHVLAGDLIGYVGSTGHVTGPHLHFEIRTSTHGGQVNPRSWLREHGVYV